MVIKARIQEKGKKQLPAATTGKATVKGKAQGIKTFPIKMSIEFDARVIKWAALMGMTKHDFILHTIGHFMENQKPNLSGL